MIMIYDEAGGDMAVREGGIFKGSYVDTQSFKADGTLSYQDPTKIAYGQRVQVTKQAPGTVIVGAPEGTKFQTVSLTPSGFFFFFKYPFSSKTNSSSPM